MALANDKETINGKGSKSPIQDSDKDTENVGENSVDNLRQVKQNPAKDGTLHSTKENDLSDVTTFEDILDIVGTRGRWNLLLFLLASYANFVSSLQTLPYQFLGATPDHWCSVEPLLQAGWTQEQILNFAIPLDKEGKREKCFMYDYNYTLVAAQGYQNAAASAQDTPALVPCYARAFNRSQYQSTVTTEWDLVCERRALYSTTQAAVQAGKLIGYFFLGFLMDIFGRRKVVLVCSALTIATVFACAISSSVELYIFLRVAITVASSGVDLGTFVLMMETCATRERDKVGTLIGLAWALGYMTFPGVAYYIRTWKWLQAALSLPALLLITFYWLLPESPRWLITQGRHLEALQVLKGAARVNRRTLPPDPSLLAAMQRLYSKVANEDDGAAAAKSKEASRCGLAARWAAGVVKDYLYVVRMKELRPRVLVVFFCWFATSLVYYGVSLNAINISVNVYLYAFLGGVMEVPSCVLLWPLIAYLGRVKALGLLYLNCTFAILILALLIFFQPDAPSGLIMFFSLSGKTAISAAFQLLWMFTPELFPTKYRSRVTGQASVAARVGSISSPYINDLLGELVVWAPSAVFCIISFLAAGLSYLLPETKGRGMPEGCTFEDETNTKGSVNQAYLTDTESQFKEIPVTSRNSDDSQLDIEKDSMKVTDTAM